MQNEQKRLDVIANNLANSATVGYKKEGVTSQAFDDELAIKIRDASVDWRREGIGTMSPGVKIGEVYTDYRGGSLRQTGNTFDFAIDGDGFFAVEYTNRDGVKSTQYTRAGQFTVTNEGYVVDMDGNHVLLCCLPRGVSSKALSAPSAEPISRKRGRSCLLPARACRQCSELLWRTAVTCRCRWMREPFRWISAETFTRTMSMSTQSR